MVTYLISKDCVSVLCAGIKEQDVRDIVRSCLESCGFEAWENTEAELFICGGDTFLVARPKD